MLSDFAKKEFHGLAGGEIRRGLSKDGLITATNVRKVRV